MEITERNLWLIFLGSLLSIVVGAILSTYFPVIGLFMFFIGIVGIVLVSHVICYLKRQNSISFDYGCNSKSYPAERNGSSPQVLSWTYTEAVYKKGNEAVGVRRLEIHEL